MVLTESSFPQRPGTLEPKPTKPQEKFIDVQLDSRVLPAIVAVTDENGDKLSVAKYQWVIRADKICVLRIHV